MAWHRPGIRCASGSSAESERERCSVRRASSLIEVGSFARDDLVGPTECPVPNLDGFSSEQGVCDVRRRLRLDEAYTPSIETSSARRGRLVAARQRPKTRAVSLFAQGKRRGDRSGIGKTGSNGSVHPYCSDGPGSPQRSKIENNTYRLAEGQDWRGGQSRSFRLRSFGLALRDILLLLYANYESINAKVSAILTEKQLLL